jgi:hypothetical protein
MSVTNGVDLAALLKFTAAQASELKRASGRAPQADPAAGQSAGAGPPSFSDVLGAVARQASQNSTPATSNTATSNTPTSNASAPSSQPQSLTLKEIASEFDLSNLTGQQENELQGQLVQAGALSPKQGLRVFSMTTLSEFFDAQHYRIIDGQMMATTPTQQGGLIGNTPGGPTYNIVDQIQAALTADQYFGDTANAATDKQILDVLNTLSQLRSADGPATS